MQLTQFTDFSLRTLIYLSQKEDGFATISEIAEYFGISRNHLVKVVHHLSTHNILHTVRGKHGGLRLARAPAEIGLGEVVRLTEPSFDIVECFNSTGNQCNITPFCQLQGIFRESFRAFMTVLDGYNIQDAVRGKINLNQIQFGTKAVG